MVEDIKEGTTEEEAAAEVIDVDSEKKEKKVKDKDLQEIMSLANEIERVQAMIGGLEVRKAEFVTSAMHLSHSINTKAKESIINAGFSEEEAEKYKIDMQNGGQIIFR